jgi:hypothetical protein
VARQISLLEENVILKRFKFCSKLIGVKHVTKRDNENWQHKHDPGIVFANSPEIISFIEDWFLHCIEFLWKNFKLDSRSRSHLVTLAFFHKVESAVTIYISPFGDKI